MNALNAGRQFHHAEPDEHAIAYGRAAGLIPPPDCSGVGFSALEWLVIGLGQRDQGANERWNRTQASLERLFAGRDPLQIQRRRLAQLKRVAGLASSSGWEVPPCEMAAFVRAGWSEDQLEHLVETVSPPLESEDGTTMASLKAAA